MHALGRFLFKMILILRHFYEKNERKSSKALVTLNASASKPQLALSKSIVLRIYIVLRIFNNGNWSTSIGSWLMVNLL